MFVPQYGTQSGSGQALKSSVKTAPALAAHATPRTPQTRPMRIRVIAFPPSRMRANRWRPTTQGRRPSSSSPRAGPCVRTASHGRPESRTTERSRRLKSIFRPARSVAPTDGAAWVTLSLPDRAFLGRLSVHRYAVRPDPLTRQRGKNAECRRAAFGPGLACAQWSTEAGLRPYPLSEYRLTKVRLSRKALRPRWRSM